MCHASWLTSTAPLAWCVCSPLCLQAALAGAIICLSACLGYCVYSVLFPTLQQRRIDAARRKVGSHGWVQLLPDGGIIYVEVLPGSKAAVHCVRKIRCVLHMYVSLIVPSQAVHARRHLLQGMLLWLDYIEVCVVNACACMLMSCCVHCRGSAWWLSRWVAEQGTRNVGGGCSCRAWVCASSNHTVQAATHLAQDLSMWPVVPLHLGLLFLFSDTLHSRKVLCLQVVVLCYTYTVPHFLSPPLCPNPFVLCRLAPCLSL